MKINESKYEYVAIQKLVCYCIFSYGFITLLCIFYRFNTDRVCLVWCLCLMAYQALLVI